MLFVFLFVLDNLDEFAIRSLFVFLKENLDFECLQDLLIHGNLLSAKEIDDYVFNVRGRHNRCERFLKLIIKKRRCHEFVAFLHTLPSEKFISEEILKVQENEAKKDTTSNEIIFFFSFFLVFIMNKIFFFKNILFSLPDDVDIKPLFTVTDELLQKHIYILYTELEPRNIADVMFQESHISISDHDIVTEFQQKHKRLNSLLDILKRNRLYAEFVCTLESLNYAVVLNTLKEDRHFICESSKYTHFLSFSLFIFNLIL